MHGAFFVMRELKSASSFQSKLQKTHMYPSILKCGPVLSQAQDKQAHVVLFTSPQAEAETPLATIQLHHKTVLFCRKFQSNLENINFP